MSVLVPVDSADDPRLADFTALTDVALRRVREPEEGLFLAEGEKVILRALRAGYLPRAVLTARKWLDGLQGELADHDCPVYVADDEVLREVTGYRVHRGALASLHRRPLPSLDSVLEGAERVLVLEDLVDHTNVGAVFRNAAALGIDAVLVSPECADPLYRRSVKVSMGAVLAVPWTRAEPWPDCLDLLRSRGFRTLAMSPDPAGLSLREADLSAPVAVLLGTEGEGLTEAALARCDASVRIPMSAGVDSLNVAAASAVVLYALGG
ncbi:MAG: RNA methyltransferase [Candidatus Nanopelagicales bacterium]